MKKIILVFVLAYSCTSTVPQPQQKNDVAKANLNGAVKSVREIPYEAEEKFGKIVKGEKRSLDNTFTIYNEKGNEIEKNNYNSDGSLYKTTRPLHILTAGQRGLHQFLKSNRGEGFTVDYDEWIEMEEENDDIINEAGTRGLHGFLESNRGEGFTVGYDEWIERVKDDEKYLKNLYDYLDGIGSHPDKGGYTDWLTDLWGKSSPGPSAPKERVRDDEPYLKNLHKYLTQLSIEDREYADWAKDVWGIINKEEQKEPEEVNAKTENYYDAKGNKIKSNSYNSDGSSNGKYTYKYDAKGNKIERDWYYSNGLYRKYTYKYDAKGNRIEYNDYNSDGSLDSKDTYKYDAKGNNIEWNRYNSDRSLDYKETYKYDAKGNKIKSNSYNSDGSLRYRIDIEYDAKGNEIEKNSYNSDGNLRRKDIYKYKFDKQNNWIEKIDFEVKNFEIPKSITEREIIYY